MTANRVVECIGSVYRYAATCGLVKRGHNPAAYLASILFTACGQNLSLIPPSRPQRGQAMA
jgi:hypothetical protein